MRKEDKEKPDKRLKEETKPTIEDEERLKKEMEDPRIELQTAKEQTKNLKEELQLAKKEVKKLKEELDEMRSANAMLKIEKDWLRERFLPSILIIDDDIDIRRLIKMYLEKDYYILESSSSAEAMGILTERSKKRGEAKPVDLIILDIMMPG
ncbi:response regulator, partial [Candidatus Aerophobetes bacterium]|nr:response regulator [Candidatus Aerophobetes bacterium]